MTTYSAVMEEAICFTSPHSVFEEHSYESTNELRFKMANPSWLSDDLVIKFECCIDDQMLALTSFGFPYLVGGQRAHAFLLSTYSRDTAPGIIDVRPDDGCVNYVHRTKFYGSAVSEELVADMLLGAARSTGLLTAAILRMNFVDAGVAENVAKKWAIESVLDSYESIVGGLPAWEDFKN